MAKGDRYLQASVGEKLLKLLVFDKRKRGPFIPIPFAST